MKNGEDRAFAKVFDQRCANLERRHQHVVHVVGLLAICRNDGKPCVDTLRPRHQLDVVALPDAPPRLDRVARLELCPEPAALISDSRSSSPRSIRCTCRPGRGRSASVRSLLADDLGAIDERPDRDDESAALTAREVLRLVEALSVRGRPNVEDADPVAGAEPCALCFDERKATPGDLAQSRSISQATPA